MVTTDQIVLLAFLILLSGFFSGIETAVMSVSRLKVRDLLKTKKGGAVILHGFKERPQQFITTILIGNNIVNIGASVLATIMATDYFGSSGAGIATGVMTFLILVFGEIMPKTIAHSHAVTISLLVARPVKWFSIIIRPLTIIFEGLALIVTKIFAKKKGDPLITEEELKTMIEIGAQEKAIEQKEKELIEGILEFNDISAREVMTPRTKMISLDGGLKLKDALKKINRQPYSRIPIYTESVDKVTGILYVKDVLKFLEKGKKTTKIKELSVKPLFVTEERIISELFKEFQEKHVHIAIVVDEFGGTAGLVTLEDLLEEIVGEIIDESDITPNKIMRLDKKSILVHGNTEIREVNDFFNIQLPESNHHITINGLIMNRLKTFPKVGAKIQINKITFIIEEKSDKKILKVRVMKN